MIHHVVSWTLRQDLDRDASIARIRELLTGLVGTVGSIRQLEVVENVAYPGKNQDVAVVATFDDLAGLDEYQVHPRHQAAAAEIRGMVTGGPPSTGRAEPRLQAGPLQCVSFTEQNWSPPGSGGDQFCSVDAAALPCDGRRHRYGVRRVGPRKR
ncbi:Dabb family protein [Curtobacterium flaccumfaciens]|nr:Dabb family protein [Curtobacterium flaccumfaciens]